MASGTGIGDFFVSLFLDAADSELTVKSLISGFGDLQVTTLGEIAVLWQLGEALAHTIDQNMSAALSFEQFTMHTGLSAQELQRWQIAAQLTHASADDVQKSVESLTGHLANLAVGIPDGALQSLQRLGISALDSAGHAKTAFQIFDEITQRLATIPGGAAEQEQVLKGLGISPNLRELFLLSSQMRENRMGFIGGMSKEQEERMDRLRQMFVEIHLLAQQIGIDLAAGVEPAIEKIVYWFRDLFKLLENAAHSDIVKKALGPIGEFAGASLSSVGDLLNVLAGRGVSANEKDAAAQGARMLDALSTMSRWFYTNPVERLFPDNRPTPLLPGTPVTINKTDTYHIHDAHDPEKIKSVIKTNWDDMLGNMTLNQFDRQIGTGGY